MCDDARIGAVRCGTIAMHHAPSQPTANSVTSHRGHRLYPEHVSPKPWRPQVVAPYRAQTYALRRRLVNSTPLDRSRLISSYIQVAQGFGGNIKW
jgi:hypothetical protein